MELKQRKRISNLPKFNPGNDGNPLSSNLSETINKSGGFQSVLGDPTRISMKQINSMKLPSQKIGFWKKAGIISNNVDAGTVTSAVNGTLGVISGWNQQQAAVKDQAGLFGMSGQRTDQAFGVNYQAQNDIDKSQAMADVSQSNKVNTLAMTGSGAAAGAAVGSVIPGVGTLIGGAAGAITGLFAGLLGGKKARERQRKKIQNAQQNANLINQVNRSSAATEGLQQQYYMDNGTTYDDLIYANRGKDLKRPRYDKGK